MPIDYPTNKGGSSRQSGGTSQGFSPAPWAAPAAGAEAGAAALAARARYAAWLLRMTPWLAAVSGGFMFGYWLAGKPLGQGWSVSRQYCGGAEEFYKGHGSSEPSSSTYTSCPPIASSAILLTPVDAPDPIPATPRPYYVVTYQKGPEFFSTGLFRSRPITSYVTNDGAVTSFVIPSTAPIELPIPARWDPDVKETGPDPEPAPQRQPNVPVPGPTTYPETLPAPWPAPGTQMPLALPLPPSLLPGIRWPSYDPVLEGTQRGYDLPVETQPDTAPSGVRPPPYGTSVETKVRLYSGSRQVRVRDQDAFEQFVRKAVARKLDPDAVRAALDKSLELAQDLAVDALKQALNEAAKTAIEAGFEWALGTD